MNDAIPTIIERAKLVAKDILAMAETKQSTFYFNDAPHLDLYLPSKALLHLMDEPEIVSVLEYLQRQHYLKYTVLHRNFGTGTDAYDVWPDVRSLTSFMRYEEPQMSKLDIKPIVEGISFDKVRAVLTINGVEIPLGRVEGDKTIQYWVCFHTLKKPNKAAEETDILNSYKKDYGIEARSRAVRDAVIALNKKIKARITLDKEPFIYSRGKVTYVEASASPYQLISVSV